MIKVFSSKKNKPHAYGFQEVGEGTVDENSYGFEPIEIAISENGTDWVSIYDVPDLEGVLVADTPYVAPAKVSDTYQKIGISDGQSLLSSSYEQRELKMTVVFDGMNRPDTELAFDALQSFLVSRTPYWICFANWPQRMYNVKVSQIEQTHLTDRGFVCEVAFIDQVGLSRSIGTTENWLTNALHGFGNNESLDPKAYTFTGNDFVVDNNSSVMVDPERRGHQLTITLTGSSSGKMKITNQTTGDYISRDQGWSGVWKLENVNPKLNDKGDQLNITGTHGGVITLQVGNNHFHIENFSGKVDFDFPMWWLS